MRDEFKVSLLTISKPAILFLVMHADGIKLHLQLLMLSCRHKELS